MALFTDRFRGSFPHCVMVLFLCLTAGPAPGQEESARPNVLLLSVDTLRADRLGCYGYPLRTSPHLDRLAETALVFEDCVCDVPLTSPSLGAMMTSRYPRMNGTTRNGLRLPEGIPTVAERFRAAGYHTFCVQSNWTLKAKLSGLHRGFDVYEDKFHEKRWGIIKPERSADDVTRLGLEFLAERPADRPFFAWVHYTDPHAPYKLHKDYNPAGKKNRWRNKQERVRARYDSEVAYTDSEIGKLLAALPENTSVVFVADHGESLYEHHYLGHGRRIYQHELRIPLVIRAAGAAPGRNPLPVRGLDVGPTLLGLAGLPQPEGMLGFDILRDTIPPDRVRVVETYGGAVPKLPGAKALMADARPMRQGVLHHGWKLILNGRATELFALTGDPEELTDRSKEETSVVEELRTLIRKWDQAVPRGADGQGDLNGDDLQALKALGYLE